MAEKNLFNVLDTLRAAGRVIEMMRTAKAEPVGGMMNVGDQG
jgi:hypothetical protein